MLPSFILLLSLFFNVFSTGVSWFMQLVHYPMFEEVGRKEFQDYQRHSRPRRRYITYIPAVGAIVSTLALFWISPWGLWMEGVKIALGFSASLFILSWISTHPQHEVLATHGYSHKVIKQLTLFQWIRTLGWTMNSFLILFIVLKQMKS